jgi:hypothetical protein
VVENTHVDNKVDKVDVYHTPLAPLKRGIELNLNRFLEL